MARYRIPKHWQSNPQRFRYLVAYCRMYEEYKSMADSIRHGYRSANSGGVVGSSSTKTSSVERKAERLHELSLKIDTIERCVRTAVKNKPYLYKDVLMSLTTNVPLDRLPTTVTRQTIASYRTYALILLEEELFSTN